MERLEVRHMQNVAVRVFFQGFGNQRYILRAEQVGTRYVLYEQISV